MIVTNSLTGGGAERSMNLVANELSKRKWQVALVPINSSSPDLIAPKCEVFEVNRTWQGGYINTLTSLVKFNKIVKFWRPDVVILNTDLPEFFGAVLTQRCKLVAVEHINHPWKTRRVFGRIIRWLLKIKKTSWVTVSDHLSIWPSGNSPQKVIANAISSEDLSILSREPEKRRTAIDRLVFVGRLAVQKRPEWLLEIAKQTCLPINFIGAGAMMESLIAETKLNNLDANFQGHVLHPWTLFREGDLLVVPSKYEGDGLVIVECIRMSIPLLVSDIPEFRRFQFPDKHYCLKASDFVDRIKEHEMNLEELIVPYDIAKGILDGRRISKVGNCWESLLSSI